MKTQLIGVAVLVSLGSVLFTGVSSARADDAVALAPPVGGVASVSDVSVFNWRDIPENQVVKIDRATFDSTGYQLYDTVGEQINVPFENDNLYVMKFGYTELGRPYFVRRGGVPTLYLPDGAYLENLDLAGARWYPFPAQSHPASPVFLGIAPTWNDYVVMGWYHGMYIYGGYWTEAPYYTGCEVQPLFSIDIVIGGDHYRGWDHYRHYERVVPPEYRYHPVPIGMGHDRNPVKMPLLPREGAPYHPGAGPIPVHGVRDDGGFPAPAAGGVTHPSFGGGALSDHPGAVSTPGHLFRGGGSSPAPTAGGATRPSTGGGASSDHSGAVSTTPGHLFRGGDGGGAPGHVQSAPAGQGSDGGKSAAPVSSGSSPTIFKWDARPVPDQTGGAPAQAGGGASHDNHGGDRHSDIGVR